MTGIERLRKLSEDVGYRSLWSVIMSGREYDWDCEERDGKTLDDTLADIADQIAREHAEDCHRMGLDYGAVSRVVSDMERHVLGHEGMEDSPVARWARELRGAIDGADEEDEAREAAEWVREHGGLGAVQARVDTLQDTLDWLRGRAGVSKYEIVDYDELLDSLDRRLMPEGIEWLADVWPRFEDGEFVRFGDKGLDFRGDTRSVSGVKFTHGGFVFISDDMGRTWWANDQGPMEDPCIDPAKRVKRPAVLAADGEPLEVGQTVWSAKYGTEYKVSEIRDTTDDDGEPCKIIGCLNDELHIYRAYFPPEKLTHQRPVMDADGVPIHEGDTVYLLPGEWCGEYPLRYYSAGDEMVVKELYSDHQLEGVLKCVGDGKCNCFPLPYQLTHTKPEPTDSWERIEEDATLSPEVYCHRNGIDISQKDGTEIFLADTVEPMARDLVRRCRALSERERGE